MPTNIENLPNVLSANEAAEILRCSPRTVQRMCNEGKIRFCRCGARYRIATDSLLRLAGIPAPSTAQTA